MTQFLNRILLTQPDAALLARGRLGKLSLFLDLRSVSLIERLQWLCCQIKCFVCETDILISDAIEFVLLLSLMWNRGASGSTLCPNVLVRLITDL